MRARSSRLVLAVTAAALTAGLAGCSSAVTSGATSGADRGQEARNDSTEQLAAARQASLAPVAEQLAALTRERQAEVRAGQAAQTTAVEQRIAAYEQLQQSIQTAGSPAAVRGLVERSGLDLDRSADPAADVPAAG